MKRCPKCWWHDEWELVLDTWVCLVCGWSPLVEKDHYLHELWASGEFQEKAE